MELQSQYPLPPKHYTRFTDEAIAAGTDPLLRPPPPLGPGVAAYTVFGDNIRLTDRAPLLSEMGIVQLFPDEDGPGFDRASELKKLNHSLLLNFLELQHILTKRPEEYIAKIEDIRLIYINIHYLLNGYRPHQARDTLKLFMELQVKRRQNMTTSIQSCLNEIKDVFRELEKSIDRVIEPSHQREDAINGHTNGENIDDMVDGIVTNGGIVDSVDNMDVDAKEEKSRYWERKKRLRDYAQSI
ncbi:MED7 protein-domain-containing protein [Obelidium mucronatum]|nr:MED7 protein-domain-containing protein [Obelidium mucronatum]